MLTSKREEEETRGRTTKGETEKYTTLNCQTHRNMKATTSHAFLCKCHIDTTRQDLTSQTAAQ